MSLFWKVSENDYINLYHVRKIDKINCFVTHIVFVGGAEEFYESHTLYEEVSNAWKQTKK